MPTVSFLPSQKQLTVPAGSNLLEAVRLAGFDLPAPCGGRGMCGKCRVKMLAGEIASDSAHNRCLSPELVRQGWRVSCVATVDADLTLADPDDRGEDSALSDFQTREPRGESGCWSLELELPPFSADTLRDDESRLFAALAERRGGMKNLAPRQLAELSEALGADRTRCRAAGLDDRILRIEPSEAGASEPATGLAVDVGTTTLAAVLCDLADGAVLATASMGNPQSVRGDDVISRAEYAGRGPDERDEMRGLIAGAVRRLAGEAVARAGLRKPPLLAAVAANPVMNHLFLGLRPTGLTLSPFVPVFGRGRLVESGGLGEPEDDDPAVLYVLPNISAYVGGDVVAGLLAHDVRPEGPNILFVDVGTNGEMVLAAGGALRAAAAAAGPAFEGARIEQGMRAAPGAVAGVGLRDDGTLRLGTIDSLPAEGLCGTGLLDAAALLVANGLIDPGGMLLDAGTAKKRNPSAPPDLLDRLHPGPRRGESVFWLARPGEGGSPGVKLTQGDVREFQLAKGAIAAGIALLLAEAGLRPGDLDAVLLAGGFGSYLDPVSAARTGLIPPEIAADKVRAVGNASLAGARLCLLSDGERRAAEELAERVEYLELSTSDGFQLAFAREMLFPED